MRTSWKGRINEIDDLMKSIPGGKASVARVEDKETLNQAAANGSSGVSYGVKSAKTGRIIQTALTSQKNMFN